MQTRMVLSADGIYHLSSLFHKMAALRLNSDHSLTLNNYAAGGYFGQYKMMKKTTEKWLKPWNMGTHLRVLSESYPMNIT